MTSPRAALLAGGYQRYFDQADRLPVQRVAFLGPNISSTWNAGREFFLADYEWKPIGAAGVLRGAMNEIITVTKPTGAGDPFSIRIKDYTRALYEQLQDWHHSGTDLRLFAVGQEWITGRLIEVPSLRILPVELEVTFLPTYGYRYADDATVDALNDAFRMGASAVSAAASTTVFQVSDTNGAAWIQAGDSIIITHAGTEYTRTVVSNVAGTITIGVAVTGLAKGDAVRSASGRFYGVWV